MFTVKEIIDAVITHCYHYNEDEWEQHQDKAVYMLSGHTFTHVYTITKHRNHIVIVDVKYLKWYTGILTKKVTIIDGNTRYKIADTIDWYIAYHCDGLYLSTPIKKPVKLVTDSKDKLLQYYVLADTK